jgi:hypothetical protein
MLYNTQNHWVSGSVLFSAKGRKTPTLLGPLEELSSVTGPVDKVQEPSNSDFPIFP